MNGEAVCGYRGGADICAWADKSAQFFGASPDSPLTRCGRNLMSNKESREDLRAGGEVATADNITALRRWNCRWRHTVHSRTSPHCKRQSHENQWMRDSSRKVIQYCRLSWSLSELRGIRIVSMQTCQHGQYHSEGLACPATWSPSKIFGKGEALKKEKHGMWLDKHCADHAKADNLDIYCLRSQLATAWHFPLVCGTTVYTHHFPTTGQVATTAFNKIPAKASENTFPHQEKPSAPSLVPLLKQKTLSVLMKLPLSQH